MFNIKSKALSFVAQKAISYYLKSNYDCDVTIDRLDIDINDGIVGAKLEFNMTEESMRKIIEKAMSN